jgi:pentatricopeptide repeat protein
MAHRVLLPRCRFTRCKSPTLINFPFTRGLVSTIPLRVEQNNSALETLNNIPPQELNINRFYEIIKHHAKHGNIQLVENIFDQMQSKYNTKPNTEIMNQIMAGYYRVDQFDNAKNVLNRMKECNVIPNGETAAVIIKYLGRNAQISQAENAYVEFVVSRQVAPVENQVLALMNVYFNHRQEVKALEMFYRLPNHLRTCRVVHRIIRYFLGQRKIKSALDLISEVEIRRVELDSYLIATMMYAYTYAETYDEESKVLHEIAIENDALLTTPEEIESRIMEYFEKEVNVEGERLLKQFRENGREISERTKLAIMKKEYPKKKNTEELTIEQLHQPFVQFLKNKQEL